MNELIFQTKFQNINFRKACRALKRRRHESGGFWAGWGGFAVKVLAIGALARVPPALVSGNVGETLAYVIAIGGIWWVIWSYSKQAQSGVREAPIRSGVTQIKLTQEGYIIDHPGHKGIVRWSHIPDVVVTPQALLILLSDYEYYPIEAKAFRDAEEMEAVAIQIRDWIATAKSRHQNRDHSL